MGLLDSLNSAFYTPQEDPFGIGASVIGAAAPGLTSPYQSSGKNIGTAVGAALLAGLLGGYAKKRTNEANQGLLAQALGALNTRGEGKYDALSSEPRLAPLAASMRMSDYENQIEQASKEEEFKRELERDTQKEKVKAYYSDPTAAKMANPNIATELGIAVPTPTPGPVKEKTILEKVMELPKEQRELGLKELDVVTGRDEIEKTVNDAFTKVRTLKLSPGGTMIPYSEQKGYLNEANGKIVEAIQGVSGKEKSDPSIERLIEGLLITPLDLGRPELLASKEVAVQQAIDSYLKRTPILEMTGIVPRKEYKSSTPTTEKGAAKVPTPGQGILAPDGRNIFIRK